MATIKILDIETAPHIAYVWKFWKENIGHKQMLENGYILSFAAKDLHSEDVLYMENRDDNEKQIVQELINILDEADVVIAHNALKFDLPTICARAATLGIDPPSPYKVVDTLAAAKRYFRFPRNTLEYLAWAFGVSEKEQHKNFPGFELWYECLKKNDDAWEEMRLYNIQDVNTLEEVYLRMRPWIRNHPNIAVHNEPDKHCCPVCESENLQRRGFYHTNVGKYQRYRCNDCGTWSRTRYTEYPKEKRQELHTTTR